MKSQPSWSTPADFLRATKAFQNCKNKVNVVVVVVVEQVLEAGRSKIKPFLLENDPETILEQSQSAVERH